MNSGPVVVDISSDEEEAFDAGTLVSDSYDWISQLLDDGEIDEFDEIMVVDEFSTPVSNQKENSDSLKPKEGWLGDESDDDCVVLDDDPDKPVSVIDDKRDEDGSDELLIVGEKGEIACRHFPHPRHLCGNFPFSTTPHEKYCNLCHCYVCDSPAPCIYWGNGVSSTNHCHSTEKDAVWKAERKSFKERKTTAQHPAKLPYNTPSIIRRIQNPGTVCRPNPVPLPTQASKSSPLRRCSIPSIATPYTRTQRQQQHPTLIPCHGEKLGQHPTKSQPPIPGPQCVQRESLRGGNLAAPITQCHRRFKRHGSIGFGCLRTSSTNQSRLAVLSHGQIHRALPQKPLQYPPVAPERSQCPQVSDSPPVTLVEDSVKEWHDILLGVASKLGVPDSVSRSMAEVEPYTPSSQPLDFTSQILSQRNGSQDVGLYPHSDPLDFDCNWLESSTTQRSPEQEAEGNPQLAAIEQPANPVVSKSNPLSGEIHLENILAAVDQETAINAGEGLGLADMDPNLLLYDFEETWSGLDLV